MSDTVEIVESEKKEECPDCDGTGSISEECPECEGSGEVKVDCDNCGGSGEIEREE